MSVRDPLLDQVPNPLERLLRNVTLVTLALGIAFGWALLQVAQAVGHLVSSVVLLVALLVRSRTART